MLSGILCEKSGVWHWAVLGVSYRVGKWFEAFVGIAPKCDLALSDNRPNFTVICCQCVIFSGRFGQSGGMRVIKTDNLGPSLSCTSVRSDKRGGIDFKMGVGVRMNVGRGLDPGDPGAFSKQETATFLGIRIAGLNYEVGNKSA